MKFSLCIPNYNYGRYVGRTIESVLGQSHQDFEILVSDNASTDDSVERVRAYGDPRIRVSVNRWNVGFAGNLDRAARGATGDFMIMLSSDDLMEPEALTTYHRVLEALGEAATRSILASRCHVIDGDDRRLAEESPDAGASGVDWKQWAGAERDEALSAAAGADVWRIPARTLLRNSLRLMRSPFSFVTTCYPRALYEVVEGYGGQRLMNPDKAFAWKVLSAAEWAILVDARLFAYRVHAANQNAIQAKSGALKHLVDQYVASFDTPPPVLAAAGLSSDDLAAAFVEQDVALRGLLSTARGDRRAARRALKLGAAAYPELMRSNPKVWVLRAMLALGPVGSWIGRMALAGALRHWSAASTTGAGAP